ncbi:MAG: serpin family protein [Cytophagales bacterium]|nr:MAG: serpin family protein [Cytophagales bacterium]
MKKIYLFYFLCCFLWSCEDKSNNTSSKIQNQEKENNQEDIESYQKNKSNQDDITPFAERFVKAIQTNEAKLLATQNNQFALNFYEKLKNTTKDQNLFFSPFSLYTALGMLYVGTSNAGKQELAQVLGVQNIPKIGEAYYHLQGSILKEISPSAEIALNNSIWINEQANILSKYEKQLKENFETESFRGNLSKPENIKKINDWVSKNTRGRIPTIIETDADNIDPTLILLNAIYFRGNWAESYAFEETNTQKNDFTLMSSKKIKVDMMKKSGGHYPYFETPFFQMIGIPYKDEKSFLYIILPKTTTNLLNVEQSFTPENLKLWLSSTKYMAAEVVAMPKIKLETEFDAISILKNMGIKSVFDSVNTIHLNETDETKTLFVSKVIHKTFLDINEKGTEAAAVTEIEEYKKDADAVREKPILINFIANRPYMFFIADKDL